MKCTFQNSDFVRCISDLVKVIPSRPSVPVLSGVLAEVRDGLLHLTSSDGEVFLGCRVSLASGSEEGSCVLSGDHVAKLVSRLPEGSTTITADASSATISWATGHSTIPVYAADDYPLFSSPASDAMNVSVKPSSLLKALAGTVYATAQDDLRPAMNGLLFEFRADGSDIVATDAKKLAVCGLDATPEEEGGFVLHRKVCGLLKGLLARESDETPVSFSFDSSRAFITLESYTIGTLLVTARFPNYRAIIPTMGLSTLSVGRKDLTALIERTAVCADRSSMMVRLDIAPGGLTIQAQDLGFGVFATDSLLADYTGDPLSIGFNARHFADVLANMTCNTVKVTFNGSSRAALFQPSDEESYIQEKAILMPLAIAA